MTRRESRAASKARSAVTLVELLLVLTLLSVTVGLIAPDLAGRMHRNRLEELSFRISLVMREAWQQAVFSGRVRWVAIADFNALSGDVSAADIGGGSSRDAAIAVFDGFPGGRSLEGIDIRPVRIPDWAEVEGLENGWCARPEGFCDEGPVRISDRDNGAVSTLRFRPYDGELVDEAAAARERRGDS